MMDRYKQANRASVIGILGNIFLLIIKAIVGFSTKSQAMISDSFNSAGDIFSSIMTFIGNRISRKKADDDHNLGHGKAEYIFSLIISLTIIVVSFELFITSIKSLIIKTDFNYSNMLIVVSIVTIFIKFLMYLYTHSIAKKYNNILMIANSNDHINDCFLSLMTLLSAIFSKYGIMFVDGLVGALLSFWILKQGITIFVESYNVLMDKAMTDEIKQKVLDVVSKHKEIKDINHFNSTPVGYRYQISLTIFLDGNLSTFESHKIADKLEDELTEIDEVYLAIIHVNPI